MLTKIDLTTLRMTPASKKAWNRTKVIRFLFTCLTVFTVLMEWEPFVTTAEVTTLTVEVHVLYALSANKVHKSIIFFHGLLESICRQVLKGSCVVVGLQKQSLEETVSFIMKNGRPDLRSETKKLFCKCWNWVGN